MSKFSDFFPPNFSPDMGDEFGYNRLSFWADRRPLKKYRKKLSKKSENIFFSKASPDLGDEFGYNRLSFWAGLRPLKNCFFSIFFSKIYFQNIFWGAYPFISYPQKWSKKYFIFSFFSSYPTLFYPPPKNYFFNCVPSISFLNCV